MDLERGARGAVGLAGGVAGIAFPPMRRDEVRARFIHGSYSRAHALGLAVLRARQAKTPGARAI